MLDCRPAEFHGNHGQVCDHNRVEGVAGWPAIAGLQTLSLNANRVDDLDALLSDVGERFPQLTYLSLLGNPCCPSESALQPYRHRSRCDCVL